MTVAHPAADGAPAAANVAQISPHIVGHGPIRVIVSHGWIADHSLFAPCFEQIDGRRFTYAFPDCRGYGRRLHEPGPLDIAAIAADVLAVAGRLGWARFHLIGHSMGGMVAQRLLIDVPDRIASAALIAPVPACGTKLNSARRSLLQRAIEEPSARRALITMNAGGARPAAPVEAILRLSLATTRPGALSAYLQAWSDTDFSAEVQPASVPLHVIVGECDPAVPLARMRETILRWHPRARLEQLGGVGHYPMQECPGELWRAIDRHFAVSTD